MTKLLLYQIMLVIGAMMVATSVLQATEKNLIILQSTTSTQNSGLLDFILPLFERDTGFRVNVVAVGTGQALKNGRNGDGDVLLTHAKNAEREFVKQGYGIKRFDVMYNDFVLIGPMDDPAGVLQTNDILGALKKIAKTRSLFISRGDDSGTHKKEVKLWGWTGVSIKEKTADWFRETGSGMGATLNIANGMGGYVLSDRATWIAFENKDNMKILSEGDSLLFNQYGVIAVNSKRHKHINVEGAKAFINWITDARGKGAIASYNIHGQQLFFPNTAK